MNQQLISHKISKYQTKLNDSITSYEKDLYRKKIEKYSKMFKQHGGVSRNMEQIKQEYEKNKELAKEIIKLELSDLENTHVDI